MGCFPAELVHNPNVANISREANQQIANYDSSKVDNLTDGRTVRDWLEGLGFDDQFRFGQDVLESVLESAAS